MTTVSLNRANTPPCVNDKIPHQLFTPTSIVTTVIVLATAFFLWMFFRKSEDKPQKGEDNPRAVTIQHAHPEADGTRAGQEGQGRPATPPPAQPLPPNENINGQSAADAAVQPDEELSPWEKLGITEAQYQQALEAEVQRGQRHPDRHLDGGGGGAAEPRAQTAWEKLGMTKAEYQYAQAQQEQRDQRRPDLQLDGGGGGGGGAADQRPMNPGEGGVRAADPRHVEQLVGREPEGQSQLEKVRWENFQERIKPLQNELKALLESTMTDIFIKDGGHHEGGVTRELSQQVLVGWLMQNQLPSAIKDCILKLFDKIPEQEEKIAAVTLYSTKMDQMKAKEQAKAILDQTFGIATAVHSLHIDFHL
ncbi:hypothetical protein K0U07_01810 [bacterium]|nr:hypothetical protein [bacterium]